MIFEASYDESNDLSRMGVAVWDGARGRAGSHLDTSCVELVSLREDTTWSELHEQIGLNLVHDLTHVHM